MNKQLPVTAHKSSILLIDDDLHQLESLANLFELDGLTPICCQTAECAMNVCKEQQVHVAILDLRMPDIDGIDLLKELKSIYPQMNIIIHTAHASVESAIAAVNEDAFAYIQKLGNVGELVSHVHRAFHLHFAAYSLLLEGVVKERDQDLSSTNKILKKEKTDRLTSEQEMREMHYALSNAMPGISKLSADGLYIKANTYCTDMLGYSKQELIGKNWETFIHPDDRLRTITAYHRMKEEGKAMFEARVLRKDSMVFHQQALMIKIADENNRFQGHHCFMRDITKRKETEDKLNYQASHDPLTGLINRVEFEKCVHNLLIESRENEVGHALCFLDLDQFKVINDTCGHAAGDRMLYEISRIMKDTARKNDTFARFGGDEFCIIMEHCPLDNAYQVALKILDAVKNYQFVWEGCVFRVGVSIGLVAVTDTTSSVSEFLKQADLACYVAKDKGRNRIHVYRNEDVELTQHRDEMASLTHIYQALKEDKFSLYAQTVLPLKESTGRHYEILIRMESATGEVITPNKFLPAAERYNIISSLDRWVVDNTCKLLVEHPGFVKQINFIAINLSGQSFADDAFQEFVSNRIQESGISGDKFCFEITETATILNLEKAQEFIAALRQLGCRFSLDDFGSGLSSYGYLKSLPVDYLKIDGMFVRGIVDDPIDRTIVRSINEIGQELGMQTIAEFVEDNKIKHTLEQIGVDYVQGYVIDRPKPLMSIINDCTE